MSVTTLEVVEHNLTQGDGKRNLTAALPHGVDAERFIRICLTEIRKNPDLQKCEPKSVLGSIMQAAQLGVEIGSSLGQAFLIPYKGECQLVLGYKGKIHLVRKTGKVSAIYAHCVYEGDKFDVTLGTALVIEHKPAFNMKGKMTHVYAVAKFPDGNYQAEVMSAEEIEAHRQAYSSMPNGKGWTKSFDEMAKKTVVNKLCKLLPMSPEDQALLAYDEETEQVRNPQKYIAMTNEDWTPPDEKQALGEAFDEAYFAAQKAKVKLDDIDVKAAPSWDTKKLIAVTGIIRERLETGVL